MPTNLDAATLRASLVHDLKVWPPYFTLLATGRKLFELRKLDRDYHTGDTLRLREWNPDTKTYTGREVWRVVTCVVVGEPWLASGYCAMGLADAAAPRPVSEIRSVAHEIGQVLSVYERRKVVPLTEDERQMVARLTMWRKRLLEVTP